MQNVIFFNYFAKKHPEPSGQQMYKYFNVRHIPLTTHKLFFSMALRLSIVINYGNKIFNLFLCDNEMICLSTST